MKTERPIYRVARWREVFETADSRRHKSLSWVSVPIGFQTSGYQLLVEEFGDDASSIYGAWIAIVLVAATCPVRGMLCGDNGVGYTAGRLQFITHLSSTVFERLIRWATSDDVRWLDTVPADEAKRLIAQSIKERSETIGSRVQSFETSSETSYQTRQDKTKPNPTIPNHDHTKHVESSSLVVEEFDFDLARDKAGKLERAMGNRNGVTRDLVWEMACFSVLHNDEFATDFVSSFKSQSIRNAGKYAKAALRKALEESGVNAADFKQRIPSTPHPVKDAI